MKDKLENMS